MVISSKTEERSLPITPAAPAPCTDRMSSPFPRKQERAGGGVGGPVHCTSPGSHPPALQGQLPRPGLPSPPPPAPSPGAACPDTGHRLGRGEGCCSGPAAPGVGGLSFRHPHSIPPGLPNQPRHLASPPCTRSILPFGMRLGGWGTEGAGKGRSGPGVGWGGVSPVGFAPHPFTHTYAW